MERALDGDPRAYGEEKKGQLLRKNNWWPNDLATLRAVMVPLTRRKLAVTALVSSSACFTRHGRWLGLFGPLQKLKVQFVPLGQMGDCSNQLPELFIIVQPDWRGIVPGKANNTPQILKQLQPFDEVSATIVLAHAVYARAQPWKDSIGTFSSFSLFHPQKRRSPKYSWEKSLKSSNSFLQMPTLTLGVWFWWSGAINSIVFVFIRLFWLQTPTYVCIV